MNKKLTNLLILSLFFFSTLFAQTHFIPVDSTGLPYTLILSNAMIGEFELEAGDEIGVFDRDAEGDTFCVGAAVFDGEYNFQFVAWEGDPVYGLEGFTPGNIMIFKVWAEIVPDFVEVDMEPTYTVGDGTFGFGSFSVFFLSGFYVVGIEPNFRFTEFFTPIQNYPNPFNESTIIEFHIQQPGLASLSIYNILGEKISLLVEPQILSGKKFIRWDGTDAEKKPVPSGVYICCLKVVDRAFTKKILLVK